MKKVASPIFIALVVAASGIAVWFWMTRPVFEKDLELAFANRQAIPSAAFTKQGMPFSGVAYDTFFGGRFFDCTEWIGRFENGLPEGEFILYNNCDVEAGRITYKKGLRY